MDGVVSSIIREANGDYIKVNYNDNDGKDHSVYVWASKKHSFEEGDTVKVSMIGNYGETVYHKRFGYQTTQYDNAKSKVLTDSQGAITKVNEKQNEELVMGEIYNAEKYHVSVKYINNKGQTEYVHMNTSQDHEFKDGDRVKVINKKNWDGRFTLEGYISKLNN